jgi:hypothetical protein
VDCLQATLQDRLSWQKSFLVDVELCVSHFVPVKCFFVIGGSCNRHLRLESVLKARIFILFNETLIFRSGCQVFPDSSLFSGPRKKTMNRVFPVYRPLLWSSGHSSWLQTPKSRVRFPALPDFLNSCGSGTGSTQPREDK